MSEQPYIINLPKINDDRGNLTFFETNNHIPFKIRRTYWIYDVPGGEKRGGHAYRNLQEFIIALSGSFDVILENGKTQMKFSLNRSYFGLYIPPMTWRQIENFSTNALALIVSDNMYDEGEYIRDYNDFLTAKNTGE
jgi:hypothetical protein